ncbi:MAG: hypothetical protein RMI79_06175 [Nitrososphaerota archaeon]|nr:hypothetical protein [Nitrososphaerota archaeon]
MVNILDTILLRLEFSLPSTGAYFPIYVTREFRKNVESSAIITSPADPEVLVMLV